FLVSLPTARDQRGTSINGQLLRQKGGTLTMSGTSQLNRYGLSCLLVVLSSLVFFSTGLFSQNSQSVGIFENHADIGTVLHPGSAVYDAASKSYTLSGSGENMWLTSDAFQFVWMKVSGDVGVTTDISFIGAGVNPHRKAVLMIRQTLDPDSAYADI